MMLRFFFSFFGNFRSLIDLYIHCIVINDLLHTKLAPALTPISSLLPYIFFSSLPSSFPFYLMSETKNPPSSLLDSYFLLILLKIVVPIYAKVGRFQKG